MCVSNCGSISIGFSRCLFLSSRGTLAALLKVAAFAAWQEKRRSGHVPAVHTAAQSAIRLAGPRAVEPQDGGPQPAIKGVASMVCRAAPLASDDFDVDGVHDRVAGHTRPAGATIALHRPGVVAAARGGHKMYVLPRRVGSRKNSCLQLTEVSYV